MLIVYSPQCLEYKIPGHPESPERVRDIYENLKEHGFRTDPPQPAKKEDILLVHTPEHFEKVQARNYSGIETPPIDIKYPLLSVGAAIKASEKLGFALTRPPGHHAGPDSLEGFCYFNNIAIAVKKLNKKIVILDLDVHHGNGTQKIFMGDKNVTYISLHQSPLYPMSGLRSEDNCHNFPLFPATTENEYLQTLKKALKIVESKKPEILAVSMGFDTYEHDPLGGQKITVEGYAKIGKMVKGLNVSTFFVLEGGYSDKTGELCLSFLNEF